MEKTVNTAWYAKKCALGTLVCCGTELVLLMLASALILRGAISEEMANGAAASSCAAKTGRSRPSAQVRCPCAAFTDMWSKEKVF